MTRFRLMDKPGEQIQPRWHPCNRMNCVGKTQNIGEFETDGHHEDGEQYRTSLKPHLTQPNVESKREYGDAENRKSLVVKCCIAAKDLVPEQQWQVERVESLRERIGVERKSGALRRRPQRKIALI